MMYSIEIFLLFLTESSLNEDSYSFGQTACSKTLVKRIRSIVHVRTSLYT